MIGFLSGSVHSKFNDSIILLVSGIGYRVVLPVNTLNILVQSQPVELYIYTHIREDLMDLYGFKSQAELEFFKLVLSVSGIGPKTALLVIDRGVELLREAIVKADTDFFLNIPRVGQKNAQRIIIDLKSKLGSITTLDLSSTTTEMMEVTEALQSMGYSKQEALKAIKNISTGDDLSLEQKMTLALRGLGKN